MTYRTYVSTTSPSAKTDAFITYRSNSGTNTLNSPKNRAWDGDTASWSSETIRRRNYFQPQSIQNLIRENNAHQIYSVIQTGRKSGMCTMNQSLSELVKNNSISMEEAKRRSQDPDETLRALAR